MLKVRLSLMCSNSRGWMMAAVLQLSVVRSILFFVMLVLWTDEQYDYGDVSLPYKSPSEPTQSKLCHCS